MVLKDLKLRNAIGARHLFALSNVPIPISTHVHCARENQTNALINRDEHTIHMFADQNYIQPEFHLMRPYIAMDASYTSVGIVRDVVIMGKTKMYYLFGI